MDTYRANIATGSELFSAARWRRLAQLLDLSTRELEILKGVFDDEHEVGIARQIGISAHTVHTHLERLYRKLDVHSRLSLIVRVFAEYQTLGDGGQHQKSKRPGSEAGGKHATRISTTVRP